MVALSTDGTLTEALMRLFCAFVDDCVMREGLLDDDDDEPVRRVVIVGDERAVLGGWTGAWLACDDFKSDVSNGDGDDDDVPGCWAASRSASS
jgi:hypothetical protein